MSSCYLTAISAFEGAFAVYVQNTNILTDHHLSVFWNAYFSSRFKRTFSKLMGSSVGINITC